MRERKNDSVRALAAEAGLSLSQMAQAKKEGVDCKNPAALKAFRGRINTRNDDRGKPTTTDQPELSIEMTIEDMEAGMRAKGITTNDARTLKIQIEGLRAAITVRKEMGQLISREEIDESDAKIAHAVAGMIRKFENEIPALCFGQHDMGKIKEEVKRLCREIQKSVADGQDEFWKSHPEL